MNVRVNAVALLAPVLLALSGCSTMQSARHEYLMRGQVVDIAGSDAVVCVGSKEGAKVGQELTVYKLVETNVGGPGKAPPHWERVRVGTVRIEQVIDEHFATAKVVSGPVAINQVVELSH